MEIKCINKFSKQITSIIYLKLAFEPSLPRLRLWIVPVFLSFYSFEYRSVFHCFSSVLNILRYKVLVFFTSQLLVRGDSGIYKQSRRIHLFIADPHGFGMHNYNLCLLVHTSFVKLLTLVTLSLKKRESLS